jgi:DNA-binding Lrp family transcriptional regulator
MVAWRSYGLDEWDYLIFLTLEQNPSLSNVAIAKRIGISTESVRNRLHALKEKRFLRPDKTINVPLLGRRLQSEVEAVYSPGSLGLVRQHVFFQEIVDRSAVNALKLLCDDHPYTHYRTVSYGKLASMYAQFDIPPEIDRGMRGLYKELQKQGLFDSFLVLNQKHAAKLDADFTKWDADKDKWQIEYGTKSKVGERSSRIEKLWQRAVRKKKSIEMKEELVEMACTFDRLDMLLLRELTVNSRPNIKSLSSKYERDPTTIGRRIKRIREKVAPSEALFYDRAVFDLTYPQIIIGRFRSGSEVQPESLYRFLESKVLPFDGRAVIDEDRYMLFTMTPPSFAPELSEFLWEHTQDFKVLQLQLDGSMTYYFYHENYVGEGKWNVDRDYFVDTPLQGIR